ncbi:MAG: hypothetical protein R6U30_04405 [Halomonas sp.]|uniref:hypothetical protein n=1 Tax=Halomonas sp. TaxID=1486246 RepID=UPI0039704F01
MLSNSEQYRASSRALQPCQARHKERCIKILSRATASLLAVIALSGCADYADGYGYGNGYGYGSEYLGYEHSQGVPSGRLPPPGECRIWYRDQPDGQQPPPGDCIEFRYQIPPGARVIRG